MRVCKFGSCSQCVHANNAECDNPKFEKYMEVQEQADTQEHLEALEESLEIMDKREIATGQTYHDGLEAGEKTAYSEIVKECDRLIADVVEDGDQINLIRNLQEKFDKTESK